MSNWEYQSFIAEGDSLPTFCYRIKHNGNTVSVQFGPVKQYNGRPVYSMCLSILGSANVKVSAFMPAR